MERDDGEIESPAKKRRLSLNQPERSTSFATSLQHTRHKSGDVPLPPKGPNPGHMHPDDGDTIGISANSKLAGQTVIPFLAEHIPDQYAHSSNKMPATDQPANATPDPKYCYRHHPDLKCRRQADEPSMNQLQHELTDLSQSDQQAITHVWTLFSAAPAKHRKLMLQGILSSCCFPQLSYLSSSVRELIRIDFLSAFPPEISFRILCYLDTTSLCKAAQVSQKWRSLADDNVVWHKMCEQHIDRKCTKCGWGLPSLERKRLRASKRQLQLRATGRGLNEWSPDITPAADALPSQENHTSVADFVNKTPASNLHTHNNGGTELGRSAGDDSYFQPRTRPWKDVYKDRFKVGINWKHGRYIPKLFKGHTNGVMCLQFDDNILATGSYDTTIKIWDIKTCEEIRTLSGHESGIRCLQFDETKLISGSIDRSLKVWNWHTGECLSTYKGHSGGVIGLHFDSALLASASADKTIKIWNFEDKSTFLLRGHTDWVNTVKLDTASQTVVSASDDCTAKLWDLETKQCIRTFEGHVGQVQQVLFMPAEFDFEESGSDEYDGTSSTASQPSQSVSGPEVASSPSNDCFGAGFTNSKRPQPPRYMITCALDSVIRMWDTSNGKCLKTYFGHLEGVWALAADSLRIVSGAEDRMVKVWDHRNGHERTFTGHSGPVTCIGLSDCKLCTGSEDCEVRMYSF
ncbi:MAG: hypothetical protein LQ352_007303 [Teloschistes flavicans]|nr:MAG: hypothetical protein LQ352_007303 [Teloschistes flavicans]